MSVSVFYFEPNGSPNLADWPSGNVPVSVYAKVENFAAGHTYNLVPRLIRGQAGSNFQAMYDTGTPETAPSGLAQHITASWALYNFSVPVRALSGPTSDRLQLAIVTTRDDDGDSGEIIHVGSDGGANQTKVETLFNDPPAVPTALERNPDGARPGEVITTNIAYVPGSGVTQPIATFDSHVGDPGMVVWPARTWRLRIWARVTSGTATITADLGRKAAGGTVTDLATNVAVATVTSSTWTLFRKDVAVAETVGATLGTLFDVIRTTLNATSSNGAVLLVAVGLDHPSSINAPLLSPAGGTVIAPADDGKVMTESDSPRWYLRDAVQSSDGSIVETVDPVSLRLDLKVTGTGSIPPAAFSETTAQWAVMPNSEHGHGDRCRLTITGTDFLGISKNWADGLNTPIKDFKDVCIYIVNATPANPITIRDGATPPVGTDFLPLALAAKAGAAQSLTVKGPTMLWLWLNLTESRWCLSSVQTYTVP